MIHKIKASVVMAGVISIVYLALPACNLGSRSMSEIEMQLPGPMEDLRAILDEITPKHMPTLSGLKFMPPDSTHQQFDPPGLRPDRSPPPVFFKPQKMISDLSLYLTEHNTLEEKSSVVRILHVSVRYASFPDGVGRENFAVIVRLTFSLGDEGKQYLTDELQYWSRLFTMWEIPSPRTMYRSELWRERFTVWTYKAMLLALDDIARQILAMEAN